MEKKSLYLLFGAIILFFVVVVEKNKIANTSATTPLPTISSESAVAFQNIQALGPKF